MKALLLKISIFFICYAIFPLALAETRFMDSPRPPPGFESIEKNQHLRVSVFFMQQYIGFFYIDLYEGQLKFHSPKDLLSQLHGIKNNKNVWQVLKQAFPLNIECSASGFATLPNSCEKLKKKSAYIIYNPKEETVQLYLAPFYFNKPKEENAIVFIPDSTSGWSYMNKLGLAGSFSNESPFSPLTYSSPNYYNLYSNNTIANGNSSLVGNISQNRGLSNDQGFQIQNLYAEQIAQNKIYTGGYIANATSPFFQTQILLGAGIKTTLDTVKNAEEIMGTPLVIFVPQASSVSIFKNDQLIFSQYLEAGYQHINTTGFPEGGYELTIKIGSTYIIHRFFTKGFSLPPEQAPQFYVIGGYLTNGMILNDTYQFLPQVLNIPVLQAGVIRRISERIALLGDVLLNSHQKLLDFGFISYLGNSFIKTAGLIATKNSNGIYTMINIQKNRFNLNLIATKISYQKKTPNYFFLNNLIYNNSISLSYSLTESDLLGVQANYNKSLAQSDSYNAGAFYQRQIGNYKGMGFFLNASYNKTINVGDTYTLMLSVNFTHDKVAGTESVVWQNQINNTRENQVASPVVIQGNTVYSHQDEQEVGYSFNEIHMLSPTVSSLAGNYNYTANPGFAATYINYNQTRNKGSSATYGGNLETEFAANQNGAHFNGIRRSNASGMMIRVDTGDEENQTAKFALLDENNHQIAVLPANKKIFISQPAFTDQNYTLINLSQIDYLIKEPTRHITLYPGNIGYYAWLAEKRIIIIGRAVTKQHEPLVNTWIHADSDGIFSDNEGNFQLELAQTTKLLMVGDFCSIHLPKLNIDKAYLYIGDVTCS